MLDYVLDFDESPKLRSGYIQLEVAVGPDSRAGSWDGGGGGGL